jgi:hypothetical protein
MAGTAGSVDLSRSLLSDVRQAGIEMRSVIAAAILFGLLGCDREPDLPSAEKKALYDAVGSGDMELLKRALAAGVSPNLYQSERGCERSKGWWLCAATSRGTRGRLRSLKVAAGRGGRSQAAVEGC